MNEREVPARKLSRQEHPRLSDVSQGPGWWEASDGRWYPPKESDQAPAPGWWLAADGKWYPPVEAAEPPSPGWWLAADGKWYPPEDHPDAAPPADAEPSPAADPSAEAPTVDDPVDEGPVTDGPVADGPAEPTSATSPAEPVAAPSAPRPTSGVAAAADRAPRTVAQAVSDTMPVRRRSIDASDQIRTRNDASRQDAIAQAPARFLAASRALKALESELAVEPVEPVARTARPDPDPAPSPTPGPTPQAAAANATAPPPPPPAPPAPPTLVGVPAGRFDGPEPLFELRTSPLGADIDHIGDRLLVFEDRVELRDRLDRVRQSLDGDQITDVVIQRKFTGAVLIVESGDGATIQTRGLRPEQAEQAKVLIHKRTRGGAPAQPRAKDPRPAVAPPAAPTVTDEEPSSRPEATAARMALLNQGRLNEADLLRKLADLHRAGVLTDAEFEDKIALVGRLVTGESLVIG